MEQRLFAFTMTDLECLLLFLKYYYTLGMEKYKKNI